MSKLQIKPIQNQNPGFTFEQKVTLFSLGLLACTVLVVFMGLFTLYRPQQQQVIVVTATPTKFALPTANLPQNQVNNAGNDEATSTSTVTSVPLITVDTTAFYATVDAVGGLAAYSATDWANRQSTSEAVISTNEALGTPRPATSTLRPTPKLENLPECLRPYATRDSDGFFSFSTDEKAVQIFQHDSDFHGHYTKVPFSWEDFVCPE